MPVPLTNLSAADEATWVRYRHEVARTARGEIAAKVLLITGYEVDELPTNAFRDSQRSHLRQAESSYVQFHGDIDVDLLPQLATAVGKADTLRRLADALARVGKVHVRKQRILRTLADGPMRPDVARRSGFELVSAVSNAVGRTEEDLAFFENDEYLEAGELVIAAEFDRIRPRIDDLVKQFSPVDPRASFWRKRQQRKAVDALFAKDGPVTKLLEAIDLDVDRDVHSDYAKFSQLNEIVNLRAALQGPTRESAINQSWTHLAPWLRDDIEATFAGDEGAPLAHESGHAFLYDYLDAVADGRERADYLHVIRQNLDIPTPGVGIEIRFSQ